MLWQPYRAGPVPGTGAVRTQLRQRYPLLLRFVILICLPAAVAVVYLLFYLRGSLPPAASHARIRGIHAIVDIWRDAHGVPHVEAKSDDDAYFALGYLHAQDRLWQLERQRRLAEGRLSEVLGKEALESDIWMRTLNLYGSAESAWRVLSPEAQASLQAYADGINAYLREGRTLPLEFLLLDIKPRPWRAIDSLAWFKVFSLSQSNSMRQEADRYVLRRYLTETQWSRLERQYPANAPVTADVLPAMSGIARMTTKLEKELALGGLYVGSNAWVISGSLTESGAPILANDPHMSLQMPSLWYPASLSAGDLSVAGMSIVGLPNIIFGRNAHIAWGGTNMMADTQDLYVLDTDPARPNDYKWNGEWKTLEVRQEVITVRSDFPATLRTPREPVRIQVRRSHLGPIVSDVLGVLDQPVSLRWPALDANDTSYEAIFRLGYARDWQEFNQAIEKLVAPAINLLYADSANNIGYLGAGRIPIRKLGDGSLPVPGSDPRYEWSGYIPFADMPRALNPKQGYLVNANNKVVGEGYPYFISRDWAPPARSERVIAMIKQILARQGKIRFEDVERMQGDVQDLEALGLKDDLLRLLGPRVAQEKSLGVLERWDGGMGREQVGAAIFNMWLNRLKARLLLNELRGDENNSAQTGVLHGYVNALTPLQIGELMTDASYNWCDDRSAERRKSCGDIALESFEEAVAELKKREGRESRWQWGRFHYAVFQHLPFSNVKLLDRVFERRIASAGSENSVDVAAGRYSDSREFEQEFGAVFRQVISPAGAETRHTYMNSTGQSGNPLSSHFDDMLEPFNRVEFFELTYRGAASAGHGGGG
jgi:penicillin amidase